MSKPSAPEAPKPAWQTLLERIAVMQTELLLLAPYRDINLAPNPGASPQGIAQAERRIGSALPPSYRSFLLRHDGWPRFFDGAALLGTKDLGKSSYADLAQAAFDAAETPVPRGGPPSPKVRGYPRDLIPFGIDPDGTTLFAFDPSRTEDGEMGVVAWMHELGIRSASFEDFLEHLLALCEADLESLAGAFWQQSA